MTTTLHEAIAAVRSGDPQRAQLLTAEIIEAKPDDANAWYLLSQLVDSEARRAAYLSKALALDPRHERARAEFGALPLELTESLSVAELPIPAAEAPIVPQPVQEMVTPVDLTPAAELPEWLQPLGAEPSHPVMPGATPTPAVAAPTPARPSTPAPAPRPRPANVPPPPPRPSQGNQALAVLLVLLGVLTLAVLAFLIYLLLF